MLAGSLSIEKHCFSFGTVEGNDLSSVRPLLHQIGVHQMDDFQCSHYGRRRHVGKSGNPIPKDWAVTPCGGLAKDEAGNVAQSVPPPRSFV